MVRNIFLILLFLSCISAAQQDTVHQATPLKKVLYLTGASVVFSGIDYLLYAPALRNSTTLMMYRVFQLALQSAITWFLYDQLGLSAAIGFNLIWWTFGHDLLYYGFAEIFNPSGGWDGYDSFRDEFMGNKITWAYWTPIGISRGMKRNRPIAGDALIAQALIGASLAFTITLTF